MSAEDEQLVTFTFDELSVLGGAFNVVCEILTRSELQVPAGIPIDRAREPLFDDLADQFDGALEGTARGAAPVEFTLGPAQAQAVRDVVGALQTMLADTGGTVDGRDLLVAIGFLRSPDQMVDFSELEMLQDLTNRIDPTGVRELPEGFEPRTREAFFDEAAHRAREEGLRGLANGAGREGIPPVIDNVAGPEERREFFPDRLPRDRTPEEQLSRIDFLRSSLEDHLDDPALIDIDEDEIEGIIRALLPRAREADDCDELLVSLAELVDFGARAVEGKRVSPGSQGQDAAIRAMEDARRLVIAQMDDVECIPRDDLRELRGSILSVTEPLESDPADVETRAFAALSDIRNVFQDPRRGGQGFAAPP